MMKYLVILSLLFVFGCTRDADIQSSIDQFTNECQSLAKCMDLDYKVEIKLDSATPIRCVIQFSGVSKALLHVPWGTSLGQEYPSFGYLGPAITICKMLKKKNGYSDKEQNRQYRYSKCIEIAPHNGDHKRACWKQYTGEIIIKGDS